MGRSVLPWRTRIEAELHALGPFRRALPVDEQMLLDVLLNDVRTRRAAGGMLPAHDPWNPLLLSMMLGLSQRIHKLEFRLERLEGEAADD